MSADPVRVTVESLAPAEGDGKLLANGDVRFQVGDFAVVTRPWRLTNYKGKLRIYAPSARIKGGWVPSLDLPQDVFDKAANALTEAWARYRHWSKTEAVSEAASESKAGV